jgi:hypothetical protein
MLLADHVGPGPKEHPKEHGKGKKPKKPKHAKPIDGRCAFTVQIDSLELAANGQVTRAVTSGTGTCHLSGLGRTTVTGRQTVTYSPDGTATGSGTAVFTAADGSELRAEASATEPPTAGDVVSLDDIDVQFTGGTGRFDDASGSAELEVSIDQAHLTGEFELEGFVVTRPGKH